MKVASVVLLPADSVGPCGDAGGVDIAALSDLTICTTAVTWALVSWDTAAFTSVSINSSGVLSFTSTSAAQAGTYYTFTGVVYCPDTVLSQYFTVQVPIQDLCYGVTCLLPMVCNPCTGACLSAAPDVEVF